MTASASQHLSIGPRWRRFLRICPIWLTSWTRRCDVSIAGTYFQNVSISASFLNVRPLADGLRYLARRPSILHPLLLTFVTIMIVGPAIGLLAAIVHAEDGSIVDLGLLAASTSLGAFVGAAFAGMRSAGANPTRRYAILGLVSAVAVALFALLPVGFMSIAPLAVLGAGAFSQAVWNTSRIRVRADPAYQARLQAITSMAFTLGFSLGMLWAGVAIDRFGLTALVGGAAVLGLLSVAVVIIKK